MRYTGHLDLFRTWERTLRRAELPLSYSLGFRPHPRISLACALPLGFTSQGDLLDVWFDDYICVKSITQRIINALPPGIFIENIEETSPQAPTLQKLVRSSVYRITLLDPVPDLEKRISSLLESTTLPRQRQSKSYDLRPLIQEIHMLPGNGEGHQFIEMTLSATEGATGRPEEIILAIGVDPSAVRVHRLGLIFSA